MTTFIRPTAAQITQLYLYGSLSVPTTAQRLNQNLIRPENITPIAVQVDAQTYMNSGGGRFAKAPLFDLVKEFFDSTSGVLLPGVYTKSMLQTIFSLDETLALSIQQLGLADTVDDWAERTYIYNSGSFSISDSARFIVELDGRRHIENFSITPRQDDKVRENFDLESTTKANLNSLIGAAGNQYIRANIDPSGIGRKIWIDFVGAVPVTDYSQDNYQNDKLLIQTWTDPRLSPGVAKSKIDTLFDTMWTDGTIKHLDSDNRPILYASGNDIGLIENSYLALNSKLSAYMNNGVHYIGSSNADTISGSVYNDILEGGAGNDVMDGGLGTDTAEYVYAAGNGVITLSKAASNGFGVAIVGAKDASGQVKDFGSDTLSSIEQLKIKAGQDQDRLVLDAGFNLGTGSSIDLGDPATTGVAISRDPTMRGDIIDASLYDKSLDINLTTNSVAYNGFFTRLGGKSLEVRGAESVYGTAYDDKITGSAGTNYLKGGKGDDIFYTGGGVDSINGGDPAIDQASDGFDTIDYSQITGNGIRLLS